ncbi:hypothetical protein [Serratia sp. 14-2641]|uniref:hypothetical protein n=1 Tax=Serratia sp. 14-2641 TaxID=1841657 RepID=UPI00080FF1B8|nr:hypothetical protein [Serratia sp. 14-2641]OCJ37341.1 hypothetical protein A6U95_24835 [Serratia sp. 14-2641]
MEERIIGLINKHGSTLQVVAFFVYPLTCAIFLSITALNLQSDTTGLVSSWVQWRVSLLISIFLNVLYLCVVIGKIELKAIYLIMVGVPCAMFIVCLGIWFVDAFIKYMFFLPKATDFEAIFALTIILQTVISFIWIKES